MNYRRQLLYESITTEARINTKLYGGVINRWKALLIRNKKALKTADKFQRAQYLRNIERAERGLKMAKAQNRAKNIKIGTVVGGGAIIAGLS